MIKIYSAKDTSKEILLARKKGESYDVSKSVNEILEQVQYKGDEALSFYTKKFDGVDICEFKVIQEEITDAINSIEPEFIEILTAAKENIWKFHEKQIRQGFISTGKGKIMGQRVLPLEKVGVYVPGGTAAYPSTVLMDVIPAKIAGVDEIIMITPPNSEGKVPESILAAAHIAGVDTIYKIGGAHGIGALAYGTDTIPKVDKIVGPGNIYVATAKRMVYGIVDIDMVAGPSDILIIADDSANPEWTAADLLAQSEHDTLAQAVLITTDFKFAEEVAKEIENQLEILPREEIARTSIENNGKIILVEDLNTAINLSNEIAPEHLELSIEEPFAYLDQVRNAGSVFLGHYTPEVLGDYFGGPNHTLPTEGTARFYSPLSVDDFTKKSSYLFYDKAALNEVIDQVEKFAHIEGLAGHARSIAKRRESREE